VRDYLLKGADESGVAVGLSELIDEPGRNCCRNLGLTSAIIQGSTGSRRGHSRFCAAGTGDTDVQPLSKIAISSEESVATLSDFIDLVPPGLVDFSHDGLIRLLLVKQRGTVRGYLLIGFGRLRLPIGDKRLMVDVVTEAERSYAKSDDGQ